jgi:hypothetical protein
MSRPDQTLFGYPIKVAPEGEAQTGPPLEIEFGPPLLDGPPPGDRLREMLYRAVEWARQFEETDKAP